MKRSLRFVIAVAVLGCASWAFGQAMNSGDITGTVTDSTGAVIPGVTVNVEDVDKGVVHTYVTNDAGVYDTGAIVPDHYLLTFTKEGFQTFKRGPITVSVGMIGINVQMPVGQESQQVVVTGEAPLLETATAEVSTSIQAETLTELPQVVARPDWVQFVVLQPGAAGTPQVNATNPGTNASANGSLPYLTGMMDGAAVSSPMSDNLILTPIFDAIAEVKMSDSLFSAQYGLGGILYNQITKGGGDHYHGMGYDYIQNNIFNAAPYGFGVKQVVPRARFNNFGGNIGGPVPFPYLRKRAFAFFAMERTISHIYGNTTFITVPSDAMRNGDFTGMNTIYDPTTQVVDPVTGKVTRQSFASEYGNGNKIPAALIDPVTKYLQKYWPTANTAGTIVNGIPTNNYVYQLHNVTPTVKYFGRFDADLSSTNRLTGSAGWQNFWPDILSPACPVSCDGLDVMNSLNQLTDVWSISSKLVNEFRMGFMEEHDVWTPKTLGMGIPAAAGLKFSKNDSFPVLNVTNQYQLTPSTNGYYTSNVFSPSDVLTIIFGRHTVRTGGEFQIYRSDSTQGNLTPYGAFLSANLGFTGVYSAATQGASSTSGSPYADYLLGYAASWNALVSPEFGARQKIPQIFAQDDFKVNSNLTFNLGVRWVGTTGWSEIKGNVRSFDPTVTNPATNSPGAMWYGSSHANGRTSLEKPTYNEWMPRVGFAYQMGPKTSIRGGYGIYTFPWSYDNYGSGLGLAVASSGAESDSTNGVNPVVIARSDGNTNYQGAKGKSINALYVNSPSAPDSYNGQAVPFTQYDMKWVNLHQWNLTVQRELTPDLMGQIGYVASKGQNMLFLTDLNQVPQSKLGPNDAASRPYPFQTISGNKPVGISNYHSLQAVITKRMKDGLAGSVNYTWSKFLDNQDTAGWNLEQGKEPFQNAYDPSANYGPSNFDIRHMFKGQVVYQLPFGKGRRFLNTNSIADHAIGGWQLSSTFQMQTGNPFTPVMSVDQSYSLSSNGSQYPNVVGNPKAAGSSGTLANWFNVGAFASPGAGVFGNMRRNSVYGPGIKLVNAALHKTFSVWESVNLDLSFNAQNVLNHPSFQQPDSLIGPGHVGKITAVTVGGRSMQIIAKLKF